MFARPSNLAHVALTKVAGVRKDIYFVALDCVYIRFGVAGNGFRARKSEVVAPGKRGTHSRNEFMIAAHRYIQLGLVLALYVRFALAGNYVRFHSEINAHLRIFYFEKLYFAAHLRQFSPLYAERHMREPVVGNRNLFKGAAHRKQHVVLYKPFAVTVNGVCVVIAQKRHAPLP